MNAQPLTDPAGKVVAWYCGKCRCVANQQAIAVRCCLCHRCGEREPITKYSACEPCKEHLDAERIAKKAENDAARFERAKKVPYAEYNGEMFYVEDIDWHNNGYFSDFRELLDACVVRGRNLPAYAWACSPTKLSLDAADVLDRAMAEGDYHADVRYELLQHAVNELQELLDRWCEQYSFTSYFVTSTALVFGNKERTALERERSEHQEER